MTRMPSDEYYGTAGQLPDALAFLTESRTQFWLEFREIDEPEPVSELAKRVEYSPATIHRILNDLGEYGLVEEVTQITGDVRQSQAYKPVEPTPRVAADGGDVTDER